MDKILGGLVLINNVDIWVRYGAFLTEKKKGGKDNLKAILRASKVKAHISGDDEAILVISLKPPAAKSFINSSWVSFSFTKLTRLDAIKCGT